MLPEKTCTLSTLALFDQLEVAVDHSHVILDSAVDQQVAVDDEDVACGAFDYRVGVYDDKSVDGLPGLHDHVAIDADEDVAVIVRRTLSVGAGRHEGERHRDEEDDQGSRRS